jgi:tetratricopeptide (TPR) repeat protein
LAEQARLKFDAGDYDQAQTLVEAAERLDPKLPLSRWIEIELHCVAGRLDEAESGCRQLIRYYNDREISDPETLRWIGQAAARFARWNRQTDQFDFLVNTLYPDALQAQADYWPAKYEKGKLFLEKFNYADAVAELRGALGINPHAAEVHAALARAWLAQHKQEEAEIEVGRALEINPRSLEAWLVKADIAWANLEVRETAELLENHALRINSKQEETLGRLAACFLILDGESPARANASQPSPPAPTTSWCPPKGEGSPVSRFDSIVKGVAARDAHAGEFSYALARSLAAHNKQPQAEKYYLEAIAAMPKFFAPRAELGLLYMRMDRESEAKPILKEAFRGDAYNVQVHNMLNLLETLDKMERKETAHCIVRFEKEDAILGRYAERRAEEIFRELCKQFDYTPPKKTSVDFFNKSAGQGGHAWFSTRVSGLPFIGTVAASTGHLVAIVSPGDAGLKKPFNWDRVLRHELVHVITLQQTNFNIPHWFTEGLAVRSEDHPRPSLWNDLLKSRTPKGKLFNLDTIESGFTRPESNSNWAMAYCQAELYVEYIRKSGGDEAIAKMLRVFADGVNTEQAIRQVLGMSKADFEKGYRAFVAEQVEAIRGLDWADASDLGTLKKSAEEHPRDALAQAELANGYFVRNADKEAYAYSQKAMALNPRQPLASYVLARLAMKSEKKERFDEAIALLEKSLDRKSPEPNSLHLLAGLKLKTGHLVEAEALYQLGEKLDPANPRWTQSLARVYETGKVPEKLAETLARLTQTDPDDLANRRNLAKLSLGNESYPMAERAAREALDIDPTDVEMHLALAESRYARHNREGAIEEWEIAAELAPEESRPFMALCIAYLDAGQNEKAKTMLERFERLKPDTPQAAFLRAKLSEVENER